MAKKGTELKLEKRTQVERMMIVESILGGIWQEYLDGKIEMSAMQTAVDCQMLINRIVWKLNEKNGAYFGKEPK